MLDEKDSTRLLALADFLNSSLPTSLLTNHINDLCTPGFTHPLAWDVWWDWAISRPDGHLLLQKYLARSDALTPSDINSIPWSLRTLIDTTLKLSLPRETEEPNEFIHTSSYGMSPKKAHEVARMASHTAALLREPSLAGVKHMVDVGAGQGYLSRALRDELGMHVLALDADDAQIAGAERRETDIAQQQKKLAQMHKKRAEGSTGSSEQVADRHNGVLVSRKGGGQPASGSLTHATAYITPHTLIRAVDEWLPPQSGLQENTLPPRAPVLFIALHACGTLTPDVLRAVLSAREEEWKPSATQRGWVPAGALVVGCCYGWMSPTSDFPLSNTIASLPTYHKPHLTQYHLQLAAQVPAEWSRSPEGEKAFALSLRKVVWRALLEGALARAGRFQAHTWISTARISGGEDVALIDNKVISGANPERIPTKNVNETKLDANGEPLLGRLRRLNDNSYTSWDKFARVAGERMGFNSALLSKTLDEEGRVEAERRLSVFQVLRCLLGPAIESMIILDRVQWLREHLAIDGGPSTEVRLANLFDQAMGSGRNVGIVVIPR